MKKRSLNQAMELTVLAAEVALYWGDRKVAPLLGAAS